MAKITRFLFFLIFICSFFLNTFAQPESGQKPGGGYGGGQMGDLGDLGVVMGMIVSTDKQPMQYATVYIVTAKDTNVITGGMTDEKGFILIKDIPWGTYLVEISALGYQKHYTNTFTLSSTNKRYNLKQFVLTKKANKIKEFEVTAKKEMLEQNLDKKVYNVENNVIADGATAVEVLTDIPSVDVDLDGAVSLRGSTNVRILIDGRPTNLTLEQIPASQIQSIEVITNPSARFEPDGMSGIINVVLKKNRQSGFNGLVSVGNALNVFLNKAYFDNYNFNTNLNYHVGKINFYINYSYGRSGFRRAGDMERNSWFGTDTAYLFKNELSNSITNRHNVKTTLDYQINKDHLLSFGFGYSSYKSSDTNEVYYENYDILNGENFPINLYDQNGKNRRGANNIDANISYKYVSSKVKGRELTSDVFYTQMDGYSNSDYLQIFEIPDSMHYYQLAKTTSLNRTSTAQIDYVTPVGNGGRIETGYKFSYRTIGQDYALFNGEDEKNTIEDFNQSNNFEFREYINAAYFIYSNTFFKKIKMQLGLRGEAANTFSDLKSADTTYKKSYYNLFPTIHIKYDLNDKNQFQISYSRRVTRPSFWDLNPFVDVSDKQNIRMGNPNLTPEFADNIELGYTRIFKSGSLNVTAFYRIRSNLITKYTSMLQANVSDGYIFYELMDGEIFSTPVVSGYDTLSTFTYTLTSSQNISSSQNFGLEMVYSQKIFAFWRFNVSGDFYRVIINSDDLIDPNLSKDWAYGVRVNQTFNLPKNWDVQLNFRFRSRSLTTGSMGGFMGGGGVGQGRRNATYSLNLGVKKGFFKNNFTVSLNIRDLIYNPANIIETYAYYPTSGYNAISTRYRSQFQANLTLTYKFNNYKERRDKPREMDSIEPME